MISLRIRMKRRKKIFLPIIHPKKSVGRRIESGGYGELFTA
jgi:hypothetical protein